MDAVISELILLMNKNTSLLENLSNPIDKNNSLAKKNISNSDQSATFGKKDSGDLNQNETKKANKVASIFISKFFEEQDRRKKDTFVKTTQSKPSSATSASRIQNQITPEKAPSGGLLDKLLGMLGLAGLFKKLKISDILKSVKKVLGKITKVIKNVASKVWKGLKRVISSVGSFFKKAFDKLKNSKVWQKFKGALSKGAEAIKKFIKSAKKLIFKTLKSVGAFFKKILSKIPGISKLLPGLSVKDAAKKTATDAAKKTATEAAKKTATEAAKQASPKQGGFFKSVGGFLKSAAGKATSAVKSTASAVASGAKSAANVVASGARAVKAFAVGPAKKAISSAVSSAVKSAGGVSSFLKVLKKVPVLGGIIESVLTYNDIKNLKEQYESGKIPLEELQQKAGKRGIQGVTGLIGTTAGGALGTALGSVVPVVGNFIGGLIGSIGGDMAGRFLGGVIADHVIPEKYTKSVGAFFTNTDPPKEEMQDFIIRGRNIYPFSSKDDIMGMKRGGAIENFLNSSKNAIKNVFSPSEKTNDTLVLRRLVRQSNAYLQMIEYNTRNLSSERSTNPSNGNSINMIQIPQKENSMESFQNNRGAFGDSVYAL